jgi:hypothetical protein
LGRDALLRAFALSDVYDSRKSLDRLTLCQFAVVFTDQSNIETLIGQEWACDIGHSHVAAHGAAERNKQRLDRFQSLIVSDWKNHAPANREFLELRESIRPIRDRLAHAIDANFDAPTVDQVRKLIHLTLDLATDMAFVFLGTASAAQEFADVSRQQADTFWGFALHGAVTASQATKQFRPTPKS